MAEIAVFRAAHGVDQADTRITGPEQHPNRSKVFQQLINARLDAALTRANTNAARWRQLAENHDRHLTADPFWPRLATHFNDAAQAGADIDTLLRDAPSRARPTPVRDARRRPVVAPGRHPGPAVAGSRRHHPATGLGRGATRSVRHRRRRSDPHRLRLAVPGRRGGRL